VLAYQRLAQPRPPEIGISLARLRERYPDYPPPFDDHGITVAQPR
jgi:hypothetical protein